MRVVAIDPNLLTDQRSIFRCEGGAVYSAMAPDGVPCLFVDEGTMADFMSEEDREGTALQTVYAFDGAAERDEYARSRRWLR